MRKRQLEKAMSKIKHGTSILFFLIILLIAPFVGSLTVIGAGYVLNLLVGIGLLQSSTIFLATLFTGVLAIGLASIAEEMRTRNHLLEAHDEWDDEDYLEDDEDEYQEHYQESLNPSPQPTRMTQGVGRNQPCTCGSKKKYKACCLNRPDIQIEDISF
jgi:hypothetical protein